MSFFFFYQIRSLKILIKISLNKEILRGIVNKRGLQSIVKLLDSVSELKALAAETIANVAKFTEARRIIRKHGGILKLASFFFLLHTSIIYNFDLNKPMKDKHRGSH